MHIIVAGDPWCQKKPLGAMGLANWALGAQRTMGPKPVRPAAAGSGRRSGTPEHATEQQISFEYVLLVPLKVE